MIQKKSILYSVSIVWLFALFLSGSFSIAEAGDKRIAYFAAGLKIPFWSIVARGVKDKAIRMGYEVTMYDSKDDPELQVFNVVEAIKKGVDGIVISPTDSSTAPTVLMLAQKVGIPVVIADVGAESGEFVTTVVSDNADGAYKVGMSLAEQLRRKGCPNGPVGIVAISQQRLNGQDRTAGFMLAMAENKIKGAAMKQMKTYSQNETYRLVKEMIEENSKICGIFLQTSHIYKSALKAVYDSGAQARVVLAFFDAEPEFIDLINKEKIVCSGMQQPYLIGQRSMKALDDHLNGKDVPKKIAIPVILATKNMPGSKINRINKMVFGK